MADQYTDEELRKLPLDDPPEDNDDSALPDLDVDVVQEFDPDA